MSIRTLLIWIIIAGALGAGVLMARAQKLAARDAQPVSTTRTIGFDPVSTIMIDRIVDGQREVLERDANQADRWLVHWSQGGMDQSWAVQTPKVKGALRLLSTARIQAVEHDPITKVAGEIMLRQSVGDSFKIEFDAQASGGYFGVRIEHRDQEGIAVARWFGQIERKVFEAFISTGFRHWRSTRIFDMPNSAIRGIELEAGGMQLELARTNTGWTITRPVPIAGDAQRIEELTRVLLSLETSSFVDDSLGEHTTGLDAPIAKITLTGVDESSTIVIGTRSDVGGSQVYAKLNTPSGQTLVTLKTDQLAKLTAAAEPYIAKTPSQASLGSVSGVKINGRDGLTRFSSIRSQGQWTIDGAQADTVNREAIDRLVGLLLRDPANTVLMLDAKSIIDPVASVVLHGQGNEVLGSFGIAIDSTPAGMRLLMLLDLDDGQQVVWGTVSENAAATGAWLTAVAGKRIP